MGRWEVLEQSLERVKQDVPAGQKAAFFQLVEHPIVALANLYRLYYAVAWNRYYAPKDDPRANVYAAGAEAAFKRDQEITAAYHALNGGKWDGMMLQTHIGYTSWQQPDTQLMPEVRRVNSVNTGVINAPVHVDGESGEGVSIVIDAARFAKAHGGKGLAWRRIPYVGDGSGAMTAFPQGRPSTTPQDRVYLEYGVKLPRAGDANVQLHLLPTLNTSGGVDVQIGVSIDNGVMQTLSLRLIPSPGPPTMQEQHNWEKAVIDNEFVLEAKFPDVVGGKHSLKVWRLDDNVLLQRIIVRAP
jgi:hypothetical protein